MAPFTEASSGKSVTRKNSVIVKVITDRIKLKTFMAFKICVAKNLII